MSILNIRTFLKFLHWTSAGLILYFFIVEPDLPSQGTPDAMTIELSTHAGMGALLSVVTLVWTLIYMKKGLIGKPGPKLPPAAVKVYPLMHKLLYWAVPIMLLSGLAVGITAPFQVMGFGIIPLNVPWIGGAGLNDILNEIHEFSFDVLILVILAHSVFHIWRHYRLKDNALRLIMPKVLHKFL